KFQKALSPNKPFFIYYAPGATHAPHHVPAEWRDKYKGKFDQGWDKVREETLERQKKLGVVPANTKLGPKPKDIKDWTRFRPTRRSCSPVRWKPMRAFRSIRIMKSVAFTELWKKSVRPTILCSFTL